MQWVSTLIDANTSIDDAIATAQTAIDQQLGAIPDLLIIFSSSHFLNHVPSIANAIAAKQFIGCSAGGLIADQREIEQQAGLAICAARLPAVTVQAHHCEQQELVEQDNEAAFWQQRFGLRAEQEPHFILLCDPFTFNPEPALNSLDRCFPDACKIGGLASGASANKHQLFVNQEIYQSGMAMLALHGNIKIDSIVAQGCRPIGTPLFVTNAADNHIFSLDGNKAVSVLEALYQTLDKSDQALLRQALFLGITMRDARTSYGQGDFLIRNIIGADKDSGALSIGAYVPQNSVVQFHLRDAQTSAQDLTTLLKQYATSPAAKALSGALMFSCLGRGAGLYGVANHDSNAFIQHIGPKPLSGFFCNGEIGPVQGTTFLHAYTSALALFRPKQIDAS